MDETEVKFTVLGAGKDKGDRTTNETAKDKDEQKTRVQAPIRPKIEYTILFPKNNMMSQLILLSKGSMDKDIVRIGPVIYKCVETGMELNISQGRILQSEYKIDNSTIDDDIELPDMFVINNRLYRRIDSKEQPKIEYKYDKEGNIDHLRIDGKTYYPIERWEKEFEEMQAERERLEKEYEKKKNDLEQHYDIAYAEMSDRLEMEKAKIAAEKDAYYAKEIIEMKKMFESAIKEQVEQKVASEKKSLEERLKAIENERKLLAKKEEELYKKEKVIESQAEQIKNTYDKMNKLVSDNEYLLKVIKDYADIPGISDIKDIDGLRKLIEAFKISEPVFEPFESPELEKTPNLMEELLSQQDEYYNGDYEKQPLVKPASNEFYYVLVIEKLGYIRSSDISTLKKIVSDKQGKLEKIARNEFEAFALEKSSIIDNPQVLKQLYDIKRNQMKDIKIGIYLMRKNNVYANGLTNKFSHMGPGLGIYLTEIVYNGKKDDNIPSICELLKEKSKEIGKVKVEKHSFPSGNIYELTFGIF